MPAVAVIGSEEAAQALQAAGFELLAPPGADGRTVAAAARQANAEGRSYVVVAGRTDPAIRAWLRIQVSAGKRVLVLCSDAEPPLDLPGSRSALLPATVDQVMAHFGAPPVGGPAGAAVIGAPGGAAEVASGLESAPGGAIPQPAIPQPAIPQPAIPQPAIPLLAPQEPPEAPRSPEEPPAVSFPPPSPPGPQTAPQPPQTALEAVIPSAPPSQEPPEAPRSPEEPPAVSLPPPSPPGPQTAPQPPQTADLEEDTFGEWADSPMDDWEPEPLFEPTPEPTQPTQPTSAAPPAASPPRTAPEPVRPPAQPLRPPRPEPPVRPDPPQALAKVVVVLAGKGGVGKTTTAASLASLAATSGLAALRRVVLVDANRGQGDLRRLLRLPDTLPTVYDAAVSGQADRAVLIPPALQAVRRAAGLPELPFAVVLAPADHQADPSVVTAGVYRQVVTLARQRCDLVVLDTQVVEAWDTSGLIDHLVAPLFAAGGAWCLALADQSATGADNLVRRLTKLHDAGLDPSHTLIALNRVRPDGEISSEALGRMFSSHGRLVGVVRHDASLSASLDQASASTGDHARMLQAVLHAVTGLAELAPSPEPPRRHGILGRRRHQ